ncbi:Signal transduction histidine kinase [Estrella lausannensis]|uniref:histidine kinase n=2 Tax=Estrella lausannensis TaxID=483423 RepID=A0A0H5DQM6_9BACT|nr:Signal transduction histidine kinase [Estrella lausannensis]
MDENKPLGKDLFGAPSEKQPPPLQEKKIPIPPNPAIKEKVSFTFSWIAIIIRGIVGSLISWFVFTQAHRIEDENTMGRFLVLSSSTDRVIQIHINQLIHGLETIATLHTYESGIDHLAVQRIIETKMKNSPFVKKIAWMQTSSPSITAMPRGLLELLNKAIDERSLQSVAIENETAPGDIPDSSVHLFVPGIKNGVASGAVWAEIDLGELVKNSLDPEQKDAMNIFVFEREQNQSKLLYFFNAEPVKKIKLSDKRESLELGAFQSDKFIHFGKLSMNVTFSASEPYTVYTWQAAIAAGIGMFITSFIVVTAWILLEIEKRQFGHVLHEEHVQEMEGTVDQLETAKNRLVAQENLASLGGLTAGIAHEIKNPLNFINNFSMLSIDLVGEIEKCLESHKDKLAPDDKENMQEVIKTLADNINTIHEQGKKADNTIQRMLAHSRGKPGEWIKTDIHKILDEYINFSFHGMRAKNPTFKCRIDKEFDESVKDIECVQNDICRVFLNLLNNAFQAVEEKQKKGDPGYEPQIFVKTKNVGNYLRIRIRDNGLGIGEENQSKIFTPFFTTKPTGVGTGLGLSLSYNIIVREHGGSLTFDTKDNEFCEFIITIPLQPKKEREVLTA